jgi:hypothetical protein
VGALPAAKLSLQAKHRFNAFDRPYRKFLVGTLREQQLGAGHFASELMIVERVLEAAAVRQRLLFELAEKRFCVLLHRTGLVDELGKSTLRYHAPKWSASKWLLGWDWPILGPKWRASACKIFSSVNSTRTPTSESDSELAAMKAQAHVTAVTRWITTRLL